MPIQPCSQRPLTGVFNGSAQQWNQARPPLPAVVTALLCFLFVGLFLIGAADWFPDSVQPPPSWLKADAQRRRPPALSSNRLAPALLATELRFVATAEGNAFRARGRHYSVLVQAAEATLIAAAPAATLRLRFVGADDSAIALHGAKPLPGRVHTIQGRDPAGWRSGLESFAEVIAQGVYPGIDVLYKGRNGHLEYDFLLASGADPAQIKGERGRFPLMRLGGERGGGKGMLPFNASPATYSVSIFS